MLKPPMTQADPYVGFLQKLTNYQEQLSVRCVLEKLMIADGKRVAVDENMMKKYLHPYTIYLLVSDGLIRKFEGHASMYYKLTNDVLKEMVEEHAKRADNKDLFNNDAFVQQTLKIWREKQIHWEWERKVQGEVLRVQLAKERKMDNIVMRLIVGVCVAILTAFLSYIAYSAIS